MQIVFVADGDLHDHLRTLTVRLDAGDRAAVVGFDAGAIHDCVQDLDLSANSGSRFLFEYFDANGFIWAMDRAMDFFNLSRQSRSAQVQRIMRQSLKRFDPEEASIN